MRLERVTRTISHVPFVIVLCLICFLACDAVATEWYRYEDQILAHQQFSFAGIGHLGAEYKNIARSLANGKGFSSPFGGNTGPTAWMPPVFPVLLAALYLLTAKNLIALAIVVVALTALVLSVTGAYVLSLAHHTAGPRGPWLALATYAALLFVHYRWFLKTTHDAFIICAAITILYAVSLRLLRATISIPSSILWGALGGVEALLNPAVGLAWFAVTIFLYATHRSTERLMSPRAFSTACLVFFVPVSIWTTRNYLVFQEFIPIKCNLFYDAYQATYVSESGVLNIHSFAQHPFMLTKDPASEYNALGEKQFTDLYRQKLLHAIYEDPVTLVQKIANRVMAVFCAYYCFADDEEYVLLRCIIHMLPLLSMIGLARRYGRKPPPEICLAGIIYVTYLSPYLIFSFYGRYLAPLIGLQALLIVWSCVGCRSTTDLPRDRIASMDRF